MKSTQIATIVFFSSLAGFVSAQTLATSSQVFPKVSVATQQARDDERKQILRDELATSQAALKRSQAAVSSGATVTADMRDAVTRNLTDLAAIQRELGLTKAAPSNQQPVVRTVAIKSKPVVNDGPPPYWDVYRQAAAPSDAPANIDAPYWNVYRRTTKPADTAGN